MMLFYFWKWNILNTLTDIEIKSGFYSMQVWSLLFIYRGPYKTMQPSCSIRDKTGQLQNVYKQPRLRQDQSSLRNQY